MPRVAGRGHSQGRALHDPEVDLHGRGEEKELRSLAFLLCLAAASVGAADRALHVACTSTDIASLVSTVGGDRVAVETLAPAIGDPHAVEVKPAQIARLQHAEMLFRIGLDHEPWLTKIVPPGLASVDLSRSVPLMQTETPRLRADVRPHVHGFGNTHYWLDPENAKPMTAAIVAALSRARPADAAYFEGNRKRFVGRLDAAMVEWKKALAPYKGTRVVVMHETWPYFTARFGFSIVAAAEPVPGVPPTPSEIAALIAHMKAGKVRVLIADPYSDDALVRQIGAGAGALIVALVPSVGAATGADDYIGLIDTNVRRLAGALAP